MKFQFKENQWFDVRKLTDWQKQWCLENLDFTSYSKKQFINNFVFKYRYRNSIFASTDDVYIQSDNELTFNDFYWEDEEVSQESIFDNPHWVTFDASKLIGCFTDKLVDGQDYKVVKTKVLASGDKSYILENGVRAHESYFHKVTPQDLLPDEDSFDNLVYVEPKHIGNNTYYVVEKDKLSENQWEFLLGNIPLDHEPGDNETYLNLDPDSRNWFGDTYKSENQDIYISFNDLFQEVN